METELNIGLALDMVTRNNSFTAFRRNIVHVMMSSISGDSMT